LLLCDGGR